MTTKKAGATKEYVLIDPYGDPVLIGDADEVRAYLQEALDYEDNPEEHKFKVRTVGMEARINVEVMTLITVDGS